MANNEAARLNDELVTQVGNVRRAMEGLFDIWGETPTEPRETGLSSDASPGYKNLGKLVVLNYPGSPGGAKIAIGENGEDWWYSSHGERSREPWEKWGESLVLTDGKLTATDYDDHIYSGQYPIISDRNELDSDNPADIEPLIKIAAGLAGRLTLYGAQVVVFESLKRTDFLFECDYSRKRQKSDPTYLFDRNILNIGGAKRVAGQE